MHTVFIYFIPSFGVLLIDAPYNYQHQPPIKVMLGEMCNEPMAKQAKDHIPVAGDTVFVNCTANPNQGGWVVLKDGDLQ